MHPAQTHAILAMVDVMETMCRNLRAQLVMAQTISENGQILSQPHQTSMPKAPANQEYLSEDEEELLEKQIEAQRRALAEQEQRIQKEWALQRDIIKDEVTV